MKLRHRLTGVLKFIKDQAAPNGRVLESVVMARTNPDVAEVVRVMYRGCVSDAFPGCRVEFGQRYVRLWLPDLYPDKTIPVMAVLEPIHQEVFNPKGCE